MRYSASDKDEIIQLVYNSDLSVRKTLDRLDIHKPIFYNWLKLYQENGLDGLEDKNHYLCRYGIKFLMRIKMPLLI